MYNGYKDYEAFYSDMSAVLAGSNDADRRGYYFAIPHLVLQSFDDPISSWRTNAANDPSSILYPSNLVTHEQSSNIVLLLTRQGGHLGWSTGWLPRSWNYMNNLVAAGFVSSYINSKKAMNDNNESTDPASDPNFEISAESIDQKLDAMLPGGACRGSLVNECS